MLHLVYQNQSTMQSIEIFFNLRMEEALHNIDITNKTAITTQDILEAINRLSEE